MTWNPTGESKHYATDCGDAMGYYQRYPIPVAAALWCGVPPADVKFILEQAKDVGRAIVSNPFVRCLEPKCRALHEAIEAGELPVYRENGGPVIEHVAPERRHVARTELREWITKHYPDQRPPTLFDETERATHTAIKTADFEALQADRDAARAEITKANQRANETNKKMTTLQGERDSLQYERDSLAAMVNKQYAGQDENIPTKERESLLKLVIGMAMKGYSYNPDAFKNNATTEIVNDLTLLGISITDDTVRKYLTEAKSKVLPIKPSP